MNNNNKRKNRPTGGGGGGGGSGSGGGMSRYSNDNRPSNKTQRPSAQGVYNNAYFMHAATALVGNVVQMRLRSGNIYEGVFRTFSQGFDVALELPSCIKSSKNAPEEIKSVPNFMIFPSDTVVSISAKDFDSQYATVGSFQTDAAISEKCNGSRFDEKELEPWDPAGMNGDVDIELEDAANGWDANEMFRKNENQFGVQSTFDDSLSSYTVPLDKVDSEEFKEREARAEKLAAEIENNPAYRDRLDLENGDEEAMFAAVARPSLDTERDREKVHEREREIEREKERDLERDRERERDHRDERERERKPRSEGPVMSERYISKPSRNISGPPPTTAMSGQSIGSGPSPRGAHNSHERDLISDRGERMMSNANASASTSSTLGQSNSTQTPAGGMMGGMKSSTVPASNQINNNMIQQDGAGGGGGVNKYVGGSMMKRKSNPQGQKLVRNTPPPNSGNGPNQMASSSGGGNGGMPQNGSGVGNSKSTIYQSVSMQTQQQNTYQSFTAVMHGGGGSGQYRGSSKLNGDTASSGSGSGGKPLPQRPMRQYSGSSTNSNLSYGNDVQNQTRHSNHGPLHGGPGQQSSNSNSPPLQTGGSTQPPPPQPQRQMRSRDSQLQELRQFDNCTTPNQQQQQQTSLSKADNMSAATSSILDKHASPTGSNPASTNTTSTNTSNNNTTAAPVKKTHVLNPSAKPFTPRSPSTPNPSRPHTPQTPVPLATLYTPAGAPIAAAVPGQQTPVYMMQSQQSAAAFHAPTHPQAGQQQRMRRSNYGPLTPSQMHASAATGQPLLATAPLPTQFIPYPQTPHAPHFQSQPYAPTMVRMYEPQPLQFLTQTPPSTTPSPGQPHQTFHPQPQPSPAGGGPQPTFGPQTQPQYHVMCPLTLHPTQLMPTPYYPTAAPQHPQQGQQFQILMPQHPAQ
uniref:LsmAD domain-containing protein n=1 Tax=Glossina palpalis gambiensis TaxID=67801 RepID=A0A1B0BT50_9MUSC